MFWIFQTKLLLHVLPQQPSVTEHGQNYKVLVWLLGLLIFNVTWTVYSFPILSVVTCRVLSHLFPGWFSLFSGLHLQWVSLFRPIVHYVLFLCLCFLPSLKSSVQFLYNIAFLETSYFFFYLYLRYCEMLKIALKKTLEVSLFSCVSLALCLTLAVIL